MFPLLSALMAAPSMNVFGRGLVVDQNEAIGPATPLADTADFLFGCSGWKVDGSDLLEPVEGHRLSGHLMQFIFGHGPVIKFVRFPIPEATNKPDRNPKMCDQV
jgi:hypothetical protein